MPAIQPATLPEPLTRDGTPRRVGVELEMGGLTAAEIAGVIAGWTGTAPRRVNPHSFQVEHPDWGTLKIYLDMADAHPPADKTEDRVISKAREYLGDAAQAVVPIEVVTPPLPVADLAAVDEMVRLLARAGAVGTESSLLHAHGMHLNVEVTAPVHAAIAPVLRAFVLIEDWLRTALDVDLLRRTLPFIDPFPRAYGDLAAANGLGRDEAELIDRYLAHNPTRNRSLDMTPLFAEIDRDRVAATLAGRKLGPRPTFHYRLPDCALGTPGWTVTGEWNMWVLVERVAADAELVNILAAAWQAQRAHWPANPKSWDEVTGDILESHGILPERQQARRQGA